MGMSKSKKGLVFTLISVLLVTFLIIYSDKNTFNYKQRSFILQQRVISMDNFIYDLEKDTERQMFIGGYRSIVAIEKYVSENYTFLDDFDETLEEIFVYGSIGSNFSSLMADASFYDWLDRINEESHKMNIHVNATPISFQGIQTNPWNLVFYLEVNYNIIDLTTGAVSWNFTSNYTKEISILGFEDPLYVINTGREGGIVTNLIIPSDYTDFVDDFTNSTYNLSMHLNGSYYIASTKAPSFIQRFEGNFSNSTFGIESLVNVEDFTRQSISEKHKSIVDYKYLDDSYVAINEKCVDGFPEWFRIDSEHLSDYEINKINYTSC